MDKELKPTTEEVKIWLLATLKHSCQVEYYLHQLDLGHDDPQRPHDISGEGNKYSWPVVRGLALQQRSDDPDFFERYVLPSIEYHRRYQYHHQKWNQSAVDATPDDMKVGAVDTLCSLLEPRTTREAVSHTTRSSPSSRTTNPTKSNGSGWFIRK